MNNVLRQFLANVLESYSPRNIGWQVLAVALTYVLVTTGFDWWYYTQTRSPELQSWLFPAAIIGGLLPILIPAGFFLVKKFNTAFAVTQAAIIALLIAAVYKTFTGRVQPSFHAQALIDNSHEFLFGFMRHGAFWGWPSSHTTVAFAMAVAIFILYRGNRLVQYTALLAALYIGISVSTNIHWFSEFVAGAIIGSVIGAVVGRSYLSKARNTIDI